jgi:cytochrome c553
MSHIAEPKNVNLNIESSPLSDKERREISAFIKKLKKKSTTKKPKK